MTAQPPEREPANSSAARPRGSRELPVAWPLAIGVVIVLVAGFLMAYAVIYLSGG